MNLEEPTEFLYADESDFHVDPDDDRTWIRTALILFVAVALMVGYFAWKRHVNSHAESLPIYDGFRSHEHSRFREPWSFEPRPEYEDPRHPFHRI